MVEVALEGSASDRGDRVFGLRDASLERLRAADVAGFLELARVHAQVAVRRLHEFFQIVERQGLVHRQRAQNAEAEALVNQPIQREWTVCGAATNRAQRTSGFLVASGLGR